MNAITVKDSWIHVFRRLEISDLFRLRLVSRGLCDWLLNEPSFSKVKSSRDLPVDCAGLSPLDRLLRVFRAREACCRSVSEGRVVSAVVLQNVNAKGVVACLVVGKYGLVCEKNTWCVMNDDGSRLPHLVESLPRSPSRFHFVVLREKFVLFSIGGFVYALDAGETIDLPNILCPAIAEEEERFFGFADNAAVYCNGRLARVFVFEEHPPFGFHHYLKKEFEIDSDYTHLSSSEFLEKTSEQTTGLRIAKQDEIVKFVLLADGSLVASLENVSFIAANNVERILHSSNNGRAVIDKADGTVQIISLL
jgi:hypothetical protein